MKLGAILKACRVRAGFSQEEIAAKLYISRSNISKLETDQLKLDVPTLIQWANVTNAKEVVVAFLMGVDGVTIMTSILTMLGGG